MSVWDTIKRYRYILGSLGGVALLAVVGVLLSGEDTNEPSAEFAASTFSTVTTEAQAPSGVPSINCRTLLSTEVIGEALGVSERPSGEQNTIGFSQGEVCTSHLEVDDRFFVKIEPGETNDFEPGMELLGATGEAVGVLADGALWFSGEEGDAGILSVGHETSLGLLVYRITLGRPDLDATSRLDLVQGLADHALRNFPGVEGLPPLPIVDLCGMVSDAQAEAILSQYRDVHPATRDEVFVIDNVFEPVDLSKPSDFSCTKLILAEIYVEVGSGSSSDFEAGSQIGGVVGEPVTDVGDEAVWFVNVPFQDAFSGPHEQGILSVRKGDALFRIVLALPDTDNADLLEIATDLAWTAVSTLPGSEPVEVIIEPGSVDVSNLGYMDNLLVKEEAGEWSLGEGLVATLRLFVGELEPEQVLRQLDLADYSGTEVLALASEYLTTGDDEQAKTEIDRLLDMVVPSLALLEDATQIPDTSVRGAGLLVSVGLTVQEDEEETPQEWCMRVFNVDAPCVTRYIPPPPDDGEGEEEPPDEEPPDEEAPPPKYHLYLPDDLAAAGWNSDYADWAYEAMLASAALYETLGNMPPASVTLWPMFENHAELESGTGHCSITIGTKSQDPIEVGGPPKGPFQQRIAARMALCMLLNDGTASAWWGQGMPIYLSGVVYPEVNLEHLLSPFLSDYELELGLLDRRWINWVFFERLHPQNGAAGNLAFARAPLSQIAEEFHLLNEDLTDVTIPDIGPGLVPYDPPSELREISGPTKLTVRPGHFGVKRLHVTVPEGKIVCEVEYDQQGGVTASWRRGAPGSAGGAWSKDLPSDPNGEMVFVVTGSAADAQLVADFKKVEDVDDGCEEDEEEAPPSPPVPGPLPCCDSDYYKRR